MKPYSSFLQVDILTTLPIHWIVRWKFVFGQLHQTILHVRCRAYIHFSFIHPTVSAQSVYQTFFRCTRCVIAKSLDTAPTMWSVIFYLFWNTEHTVNRRPNFPWGGLTFHRLKLNIDKGNMIESCSIILNTVKLEE